MPFKAPKQWPGMDVQTVTVVGAGTMGSGIAQVCCQAGYRTHLHDASDKALETGVARILGFWERGIAKGKTSRQERDAWKDNLHWRGDLMDKVSGSQLAIEAVPEDLDVKRRIFAQLDDFAPEGAVLATNTSSLSVAAIAAATSRPQDVLGMHFFNPVPLMRLLEIVRHDGTSDEAAQCAVQVAARLGKTPVTVRDRPGFATSRLGIVLGNEAARMLEEGVASAADIDTAMRLGYGHPMGPLELSDVVGLDVRHAITRYLHETLGGEQFRAPAVTERLVAAGELGKKTGKGFYDWSDGSPRPRPLPPPQVATKETL